MKATLIKLETKVIDMPDHRSVWRELIRPSGEPLMANYEGMSPASVPMDFKTVDYRVIRLRGGQNGEDGLYLVNDDMWYTAIPLLEDVVEKRLRPLEEENTNLKVGVAMLKDRLDELENSWWERLKSRFTNKKI